MTRSLGATALLIGLLALGTGSVWAATITGTSRDDTLRGGARADRIFGKAGNDRLFGGPGDDLVVGGPGRDVLVGGAGADTLRCGPGRDSVTRDAEDRVANDCEVVRGPKPAPPSPVPPGPPPVPPPPDISGEPGYWPSLPKPSFADRRDVDQPWVGEWGPKADPYWLNPTGTLRALVVPVDFPDVRATTTIESYRNYLEPTSEAYYREVSYGRLNLDLDFFPRWVRMSRSAASYGLANCCPQQRLREFVSELTALVDSEVNFSTVDAVFAVAPQEAGPYVNILLYRAWPGEGVTRDGRELRWGVVGNGGLDPRGPTKNLFAHHFVTHELGHLLGLPDLYDPRQRDAGAGQFAWAGRWDIMSDNRASSHMFAWHKWLLGWLDGKQLRGLEGAGSTEATLAPLEIAGGLKAIVVRVSPTVVYVIENRQRLGEDSELCEKGVLVWIVDAGRFNADRNAVVQPAGRSFNDECGAIFDAAFDVGAVFDDGRVKVEVLEAVGSGYYYRVRVTLR